MNEYYCAAIDILNSPRDWKQLSIAIAKLDPALFCKAAGIAEPWEAKAISVYNTEGKIPAIKFVRNTQDLSLADAKYAVDRLISKAQLNIG